MSQSHVDVLLASPSAAVRSNTLAALHKLLGVYALAVPESVVSSLAALLPEAGETGTQSSYCAAATCLTGAKYMVTHAIARTSHDRSYETGQQRMLLLLRLAHDSGGSH